MRTIGIRMGIVAFIAIVLVSLIPYVGSFVIAPIVALAVGSVAGRQAAALARTGATSEAAKTGALVGVGALVGSIIGLAILVMFIVDIPAVQEIIRNSEPNVEARIPYEWMVPLGGLTGVVVGFFVGLFDLGLAFVGGLLAGWVFDHNRRVSA